MVGRSLGNPNFAHHGIAVHSSVATTWQKVTKVLDGARTTRATECIFNGQAVNSGAMGRSARRALQSLPQLQLEQGASVVLPLIKVLSEQTG
mmetsp:Transcript_34127/g.47510  ORF Transcript_34127/g.47510 Transcript_34127/m.47510 type:complete len:92 (-) Transcript_34127:334-609(-)